MQSFSIEKLKKQMDLGGLNANQLIKRMVLMTADNNNGVPQLKPTPSYISYVLGGRFKPKWEYLQLMAKALNCRIEDLTEGDSPKNINKG